MILNGDPGAIRTRDFQLRRLALYPAELPGHDRQQKPTMCRNEAVGNPSKRQRLVSKCIASVADTIQSAQTLTGGPVPPSQNERTRK